MGIAPEDAAGRSDDRLVMFVFASGNDLQGHSPYGLSMRLSSDNVDADSVEINRFSASLEGRAIEDISLHNIHSRTPVELGSKTVDVDPAPCCLFWVATNRFDLTHKEDEVMTVQFEFCLIRADGRECVVEERRFRAVVREGLFRMNEV